jgi:hypothetical protein
MHHFEHIRQSLEKFGKSYSEVHHYLDEFFGDPNYGTHHRKKRHHLEGIEEVRLKWGDDAALAARAHIESDLRQEGWKPERDPFPKNEMDYVRMGFW